MTCEWYHCSEHGKTYTIRSADETLQDSQNYFPIGVGIQRVYCPMHREIAIMKGFFVEEFATSIN